MPCATFLGFEETPHRAGAIAIKNENPAAHGQDQAFGVAHSAEQALDILELLSGRGAGMTLREIAQELAIPPSSLHGILRLLAALHYLAAPDVRWRYLLGAKALELGAGYLSGSALLCRGAAPDARPCRDYARDGPVRRPRRQSRSSPRYAPYFHTRAFGVIACAPHPRSDLQAHHGSRRRTARVSAI